MFKKMYDDGLIYRGHRIVNWDPKGQTTISDDEIVYEARKSVLYTFKYSKEFPISVATTRLETKVGDTSVAVHPDDERYTQLIGKSARHPFDGREILIVADVAIDPAFGTGAVKVTPAHDPVDFEIAQRTGLPLMNIFRADATINENAAEEFYGLGRYDARIAVREELEKLDLIVEEIRPYVHSVGHCYRCHSEIEPWIAGLQWFVAVRNGRRVDGLRAREAVDD